MKALTGLPTEAYLKVSEEANIQLADLLQLVQALEKGATPAYLARYRPDVCGGLDERAVLKVQSRLRSCLEIVDRKVSILAAVERQGALTPELRQRLEQTMDRRDLEDLYLPYRPKKPDGFDEACQRGLEPLARFLWAQNPSGDIEAEAAKFVAADKGVADPAAALAGAYAIAARWLSEKFEIRRELRKLFLRDGEIVVFAATRKKARKHQNLIGYRSKASKISWRQILMIRRAARDGVVDYRLEIPTKTTIEYLAACLITDKESPYSPHIERLAEVAANSPLILGLRQDVLRSIEDRSDAEAVQSFEKSLRKGLLTPPARGLTIAGLETGRPGGWRAAVVNPAGEIVGCAIVRSEQPAPAAESVAPAAESVAPAVEPIAESAAPAAEPTTESDVPAVEPTAEPTAPTAESAVPGVEPTAEPTTESVAPDTPVNSARQVEGKEKEANPDTAAQAEDEKHASSDSPEDEKASAPEVAAPPSAPAEDRAAAVEAAVQESPPAAPKKVRQQPPPVMSLAELLAEHNVDLVVFPNGPGLRQTERFLRAQIRKSGRTQIVWQSISDAGTWIYAGSKSAKQDMPQWEPAMRGAVCLARRVRDPLSEMVKVDPKTLGIGPGHHEVEPKRLREALQATVEECVHEVGVDLNQASRELLSLVPGLTERLAKRIVEHRTANGALARREDVRKAPGLNERIYRQAAGFLRVQSENPLDATGVHPSSYALVHKLVSAAESDIEKVLADPAILEKLNLDEFAAKDQPLARVQAVVRELHPRRRNVRGEFQMPQPAVQLRADEEFSVGAKLEGTVVNVTAFGAFVDIGGDRDGLLHMSQIADELVKDSKPAIKTGDRIAVFITGFEQGGKRISLSMRGPRPERVRPRAAAERTRGAAADGGQRRRRTSNRREDRGKKPVQFQFGPKGKDQEIENQRANSMSLEDKLLLLKDKYRTKT